MQKISAYIIFFAVITINSLGQQDPQISHYMFNTLTYNPAYAGVSGEICFNFLSHQQWKKFEGAPLTNFLTADMPLNIKGNKFGIGLLFMNDTYGFVTDFKAALPLSYGFDIGLSHLQIGIQPGIFNKKFSPSWKFPDQDENILNNTRPVTVFDLSLGIFFEYDNLFAGFSTTHITRPGFYFEPQDDSSGRSSSIYLTNHFYLNGGYNFQLASSMIDVTPNFLIKSDISSTQIDINVTVLYNKKIWGGVSYRNKDAIIFMIGTSYFKNVKLGLSYDWVLSSINKVSSGTFEAYIGYCFSIEKAANAQRYGNVKTL